MRSRWGKRQPVGHPFPGLSVVESTKITLENLTVGQQLRGVVSDKVVTIVGVEHIDDDLVELFYRDDSGKPTARTVTTADASQFQLVSDAETRRPFDASIDEFRLAAEAWRIKYAALYDPMVAVSTSDVDPLPHQIRAVYEEMLPKVPLRFLLADDPGAGKTIMAGLYIKELMLRSGCERAIIVAPGGLVEQWREELATKFDLRFEIFDRKMVDDAAGTNAFMQHPYLIARMDQLARNDDLMEQLQDAHWDVAVVDEAHRMSARYTSWDGSIDRTRRFDLGRLLSQTAHHFLLMTATPHAGKEEDYQLFLSLLDQDRFEGQFKDGIHRTDTEGIMRRMVKEDLLTFEGTPLFPERRAYTVQYDLSPQEQDLYEQVTDYVRTEMGRAERLAAQGDRKRGNNVGFALTVLQRRLASSPEAILRSLERRRSRLQMRVQEVKDAARLAEIADVALPDTGEYVPSVDQWDDDIAEVDYETLEEQLDQVVDLATAAQTIPELEAEIAILEDLIITARKVRHANEDRKWVELRKILDQRLLSGAAIDSDGGLSTESVQDDDESRKIIIFTEHRDTLEYLREKITSQFGRSNAVLTIHGGTKREDRRLARERFTHDPDTVVLLATDAAGEGLNLQRAHLMVNYDLPWNPNRIEQRFGRIHRIGQRRVCHLWNLVASNTREGDVFVRLLSKIETMREAYNGNLFNVLGESDAFENHSLKDLLIRAIRYGDEPGVQAQLSKVIDAGVNQGLNELLEERALHSDIYGAIDLEAIRARMEHARERRLQPGYINAFFNDALERLGGRIKRRERGRWEITRVPPRLIELARRSNRWSPLADAYERVTFETQYIRHVASPDAELIAPGHPLLNTVIDATIIDQREVLQRGAVFVDRGVHQLDTPTLMYIVEQRIESAVDGQTRSHHFDYPVLSPNGDVVVPVTPPYLDYDDITDDERSRLKPLLEHSWLDENHERTVRSWSYREGMLPRLTELQERVEVDVERTKAQVTERLQAEINHWYTEHLRLEQQERNGDSGHLRAAEALRRAESLVQRLDDRLRSLEESRQLSATPAIIRGVALIVPSNMLRADEGDDLEPDVQGPDVVPLHGLDRDEVERRAVEVAMAAEAALGRRPVEMVRNNPGFDIKSTDKAGRVFFIEVKGRIQGADSFTITSTEVSHAQTHADRYRLALVSVSPDSPAHDELRYVVGPFGSLTPSTTTRSFNEHWAHYWERGGPPC